MFSVESAAIDDLSAVSGKLGRSVAFALKWSSVGVPVEPNRPLPGH